MNDSNDWSIVELHSIDIEKEREKESNNKQNFFNGENFIYENIDNTINASADYNILNVSGAEVYYCENIPNTTNSDLAKNNSHVGSINYKNKNSFLIDNNSGKSNMQSIITPLDPLDIEDYYDDNLNTKENKFETNNDKIEILFMKISKTKTFILTKIQLIHQMEFLYYYIALGIAILLYNLSLEKCMHRNEFKCWNEFYPKLTYIALEALTAAIIFSLIYIKLFFHKHLFFHRINIITYMTHIILFIIDDGVDFTGSHGGFNRLFMNSLVILCLLIYSLGFFILKIIKLLFSKITTKLQQSGFISLNIKSEESQDSSCKKHLAKVLFAFFIIFIYFAMKKMKSLIEDSCQEWDRGFKGSKMDKATNCYIEKPKVCYNKLLNEVFDFSKYFPNCKSQKIHNADKVNEFYKNEKFILYPDTKSFTHEEKDYKKIQLLIQREIKPVNYEAFIYLMKKNITNVEEVYLNRTDDDINKHKLIYNIPIKNNLVSEAEQKRDIYKTKAFTSHEIFDEKDLNNLKIKKEAANMDDNTINNYTNMSKEKSQEYIDYIQEKSENILKSLFSEKETLVDNVIFLFIDTLSRPQFRAKLPNLFSYLENFYKNKTSNFESYQFFKYHATQPSTILTYGPTLHGTHPTTNDGVKDLIHSYYKAKGFITAHALNQCSNLEMNYNLNDLIKFNWKNFDYEFFTPFCDPGYTEYGKETGFLYGPYSFFRRCLYGKDTFEYVLDYSKKFFFETYAKQRKFLQMSFIDGHEWTNEVVKFLDLPLVNFLKFFENKSFSNNNNDNTAIILLSDHGLHMNGPSIILKLEDVEKEKVLPFLYVLLPRRLADSHLGKSLELNENKIIGGYDIHNILKTLVGSDDFSPYGTQPFSVMPSWRGCLNIGVPDDNCKCQKLN